NPTRPVVVVRVVLDTPANELRSARTLRHVRLVRRRLAELIPTLERWAEVTGPRNILLAGPRSFCAGVERAIEIVERAIDRFEAPRFAERGYDIVLIGRHDHEEVEGTVGEAAGRITVVDSPADVDALEVRDPDRVAYLTQTTLATDEVAGIVAQLKTRFPALV